MDGKGLSRSATIKERQTPRATGEKVLFIYFMHGVVIASVFRTIQDRGEIKRNYRHTTKDLMSAFYRNWLDKGMDIPTAFRIAQLEMKKKNKDPEMWAGFVLVQ